MRNCFFGWTRNNKTRNTLVCRGKIGRVGQREILFQTKDNKFKMLFEHRNKSLRIIKNSYKLQKRKRFNV